MANKKEEMLPSTERQWKEKVKAAKNKADEVYGVCHRKFTGIVMRATYLTTEQKEKLVEDLNKS